MAITKFINSTAPADDAEITAAATFTDRLDIVTSGVICVSQRIQDVGENIRAYDIKQAFTYASGTWSLILDNDRDTALCLIKIIVTNAVGVEQRIIHDFGQVSVTGGDAETTFTATGVAAQTLTASERLAVSIINDDGERAQIAVNNISGACDSRLLTPDESAGAPAAHKPIFVRSK